MSSSQIISHYPALPAPVTLTLHVLPQHPCVYLPDKTAQMRGFAAGRMPPEVYHAFMDAGFRRSGRLIYQPICGGCRACVPIRLAVDQFVPSKSQRRRMRKNAEISIAIESPRPTDEKYGLYCRYLHQWHGDPPHSREAFEQFLYDSPVRTIEFTYRDRSGELLAVGICDVCAASLSSVYFYFEPSRASLGLGTYGVLQEIEYARSLGIPHYYLGYWVRGCRSMQYKTDFMPAELLGTDGKWEAIPPRDIDLGLQ
jgi:arginyl-tRNA--protein-N-Asp/Glu arginylyltransferase